MDNFNLERKVVFIPAYDCRKDPGGNYGIHGLVIEFQLKGPEGVVVWDFHTGIYLEANREEHKARGHCGGSVYGNEVCAHATKPFEGSTEGLPECGLLGGVPCHAAVLTGGLFGRELGERLIAEGADPVWAKLESHYLRLWPQQELQLGGPTNDQV